MVDRFVSQSEVDEKKRKRQEEWEKVRRPEEPQEAPEDDYDPRSLFHRLKEVRDKKQETFEEEHKFKNMLRGLDKEEVDFFSVVDSARQAENRKKKDEEKELLDQMELIKVKSGIERQHAFIKEFAAPSSSSSSTSGVQKQSKQAKIISGAIKRKSEMSSDKIEQFDIKRKVDDKRDNFEEKTLKNGIIIAETSIGLRPTAMTTLGVLPGMDDYSVFSDSSSTDSSDSENDQISVMNMAFLPNSGKKSTQSCAQNKQNVSQLH